MDFESSNPNMYDLVAYRIRYTPHPHAGDGWCIYPNYDFTHGICDSLEHIDYSICTLEFESRREPYYWILWALDLYRPNVFEMTRLNLQYTVLSKRRLIKLVDQHYVRGWDDPRMPTISGLRRRGYTKEILNAFCNDLGATRARQIVEIAKLEQTARLQLSASSRRVMAALTPVRVVITNYNEESSKQSMVFEVQNSPTDESLGKHSITLTSEIFIDETDFRLEDSPQYYGLAPNKAVGLKYYGGNLVCDEVIMDKDGETVLELKCHVDSSEDRKKPKTFISWVPSDSVACEVRVYSHLFTVPEPTDLWQDELNPQSEVVHPKALVDPSIKEALQSHPSALNDKWSSNVAVQFERMGYFVADYTSTFDTSNNTGLLVFNRTVSLKEEAFKKQLTAEEEAEVLARKARAKKDVEEKARRMQIDPKDLFKLGDEFKGKYSKYDDDGIPTHDIDGTEITKSMTKKLLKEKQKHMKQQAAWKNNNP